MIRRLYLALVIRPRPALTPAEIARRDEIRDEAARLVERNRRERAS